MVTACDEYMAIRVS